MVLNAGLFAAKRTAICCKTQGKMVQNARLFAAKRSVKCIILHTSCMNLQF